MLIFGWACIRDKCDRAHIKIICEHTIYGSRETDGPREWKREKEREWHDWNGKNFERDIERLQQQPACTNYNLNKISYLSYIMVFLTVHTCWDDSLESRIYNVLKWICKNTWAFYTILLSSSLLIKKKWHGVIFN